MRKIPRKLIFLTALSAALWLFAPTLPQPKAAERSAQKVPNYAPAVEMLDAFIAREMKEKDLPAVSIALVDDQTVVWSKGFGFADPEAKISASADTVYRVGSISKLFTDIAIMQLAERGDIDIDAPLTNYLPEFRPKNSFGKAITLRQLMSHRSGLVREPPVGNYFDPDEPTLAETIASLNKTSLIYAPETRTKYSNAGIAAVGYVLEKTQDEPFANYLRRSVLDPLGMQHSSFEPTPDIEKNLAKAYMWTTDGRVFPAPTFQLGISPAGSMYTTVGDLGRFISAVFADGRGVNGQMLSRESLEKMWTPQYARPGQRSGFGLGFGISEVNGHRKIGHGGAIYGFASQLSMLPDDKLGVIVVTTKDAANAVTSRIADAALEAMLAVREGRDVKAPESTRDIDSATAQEIAGHYANTGGEAFDITLNAANKLIFLRSTGGFPAELRATSDGTLITDGKLGYGLELTPQKDRLKFGGVAYKKTVSVKPPAAPEKWRELIGEYGHDHDVLFIIEKDGKLHAVIEWFEYDPLEEVSRNVFNFPKSGLYDGEQLIFTRDKSGRATSVTAGGVKFDRRSVGPEGTGQLRIKPVRPVAELLKEALKATPPTEKGEFLIPDLVEVAKLDPTVKLDIRYATTNNFLGSVFYSQPKAIMQRPAAEAVVRANKQLKKLGYGLLIHDAYRPWYVTKVFWDATPDDKKIFVADPSQGSRHNRGMAVDITLYDLKTGKPIEMVGTYDEISDRSYPDYPGGTSLRRWHRKLLRDAMEAEGFRVYEAEWWHFDYKGWTNYTIGNEIFENIVTESN